MTTPVSRTASAPVAQPRRALAWTHILRPFRAIRDLYRELHAIWTEPPSHELPHEKWERH